MNAAGLLFLSSSAAGRKGRKCAWHRQSSQDGTALMHGRAAGKGRPCRKKKPRVEERRSNSDRQEMKGHREQ